MCIRDRHKAAQLLKEKGSEAFAVLADPKSEFNDRDAYLFIIDVDKRLVVSNPRFPERTGGNIREHLDWSGKHYGVEPVSYTHLFRICGRSVFGTIDGAVRVRYIRQEPFFIMFSGTNLLRGSCDMLLQGCLLYTSRCV